MCIARYAQRAHYCCNFTQLVPPRLLYFVLKEVYDESSLLTLSHRNIVRFIPLWVLPGVTYTGIRGALYCCKFTQFAPPCLAYFVLKKGYGESSLLGLSHRDIVHFIPLWILPGATVVLPQCAVQNLMLISFTHSQ